MDPGADIKVAELSEEERFKKKFPGKKPATTDFLRKRLQKGVKYFDSGDYNMAKSEKKAAGSGPSVGKAFPTHDHLAQRKISTSSKSTLVEPHLLAAALHNEEKRLEELRMQQQTEEKDETIEA